MSYDNDRRGKRDFNSSTPRPSPPPAAPPSSSQPPSGPPPRSGFDNDRRGKRSFDERPPRPAPPPPRQTPQPPDDIIDRRGFLRWDESQGRFRSPGEMAEEHYLKTGERWDSGDRKDDRGSSGGARIESLFGKTRKREAADALRQIVFIEHGDSLIVAHRPDSERKPLRFTIVELGRRDARTKTEAAPRFASDGHAVRWLTVGEVPPPFPTGAPVEAFRVTVIDGDGELRQTGIATAIAGRLSLARLARAALRDRRTTIPGRVRKLVFGCDEVSIGLACEMMARVEGPIHSPKRRRNYGIV